MSTIAVRRMMGAQSLLLGGTKPPRPPTLHQLRLLQVWQWEGMRLSGAAQLCHQYGFTGLLVKALDGTSWMSQFDSAPDALGSLAELAFQADFAHNAGLYYFAWTVPQQLDWQTQAVMTAGLAKACDGVFLDVEPYSQFWGPWAPVGLASQFMQRIRQNAPDAFIALQPDPRPGHLAEIRIGEWASYVDALAGQHYWSDFGTDPTTELNHAAALELLYGLPVLPTLPGNAPTSSFPLAVISEFSGFVVWRMGTTPPATLAQVGNLAVTGLETDRIKALG